MVRIALNLDEIQTGPQNIEKGKWRAKLLACDEEESAAGNPMLVWDWKIVEGPSEGLETRSWSSLLDHALGSFKNHAEAFGFHGDTEVDTDKCVGKYAMLVIGSRKRRNRDTGDEEEVSTVVTVLPDEHAPSGNGRPAASSGARRIGGGSSAPARRAAPKEDDGLEELPF